MYYKKNVGPLRQLFRIILAIAMLFGLCILVGIVFKLMLYPFIIGWSMIPS